MQFSRRGFLAGLISTAGILRPGQCLQAGSYPSAPKGAARLPSWTLGNSSVSTETPLMFRGNGSHTFYGTGPIPETAPRILWKYQTRTLSSLTHGVPTDWAGTGWTGTAVKHGNYVFVGSVCGEFYAFDAMTGTLIWRALSGGKFKSSACLFENRLYIGNTDNLLRCMDAATGRIIWTYDTGNDLDSSPCVIDGRLYVAGESGYVRCFDPRSGEQIWKSFVGGIGEGSLLGSNGSETSPAVADGALYGATYDGELYCLDTVTGEKRWIARTGDDTDASITVAGEYLYAAAEEKSSFLFCFARSDGREVWRYAGNPAGYWSTPAVADGRVHIGGEDGALHTVDATTGIALWTFKTGEAIWSSPAVVDGKVIFGSRDAHLYCLDAKSGALIWRLALDGRIISSPCIAGGTIWIGTATGYFYGIGAT